MIEWTKAEEKILIKRYPVLGSKVQKLLPGRTLNAIDHKVRVMGIKYGTEGKAGYLDIESGGLKADFDVMFTWYIKTEGKDEFYYGQVTKQDLSSGVYDKRILQELLDTLEKYDIVYTYYGTRFDIPFIRSRVLSHNLDFIPYGKVKHKDIYYLARRSLCIHSNRLESVCDLLGIEGKSHIKPRIWMAASVGNKQALDYILEHNRWDVIILEQVHQKLKDYELGQNRFF